MLRRVFPFELLLRWEVATQRGVVGPEDGECDGELPVALAHR